MKKKKNNSKTYILLLSAVALLCALLSVKHIVSEKREQKKFNDLSKIITLDDTHSIETAESQTNSSKTVESDTKQKRKRNLSELINKNNDCIGWISIPDTAVDYPVMHTPNNPKEYLYKNFYGYYSQWGVPFLDSRCDLECDNLIVYGHNMHDGTMFSSLCYYANYSYCLAHPVIEFESENGCEKYNIFAVIPTTTNDEIYKFISVYTEKDYDKVIKTIKKKSKFDFGITPEYGDRLLTLSTCYGSNNNGRILIIARMEAD